MGGEKMGFLIRRFRLAAALASLVFLVPLVALAQEAAPSQIVITDPTGGILSAIPGGIYIYALVVAIAGLVSTFVADSKLPKFVATVLNWLSLNVGKAKNDPGVN